MITDTNTAIENRVITRQLNIRVPAQLLEELKRQAADEAETESTIVRRALRRELRRELVIETR